MAGPDPAVAAVRVAVRRSLRLHLGTPLGTVVVAVSGGADSLALAAAAGFVVPREGGRAVGVVVDHGLQDGSAAVAAQAADRARQLGLPTVEVVRVEVVPAGDGPEASARAARMEALARAARRWDARAVLLGHTRDDQAEQVLLGLLRGSGAASLSGMPPARRIEDGTPALLLRPLLGTPRRVTTEACAALGLQPWQDPHNEDRRFARVRARAALADLERDLGPGTTAALARTAGLLRDDAEVLQDLAETAYRDLGHPPWPVGAAAALPAAVRRRLWHRAALEAGSPGAALAAVHLAAVDALLTDWHGQGPVDLPGGVRAGRRGDLVWIGSAPPS
jgi:tRNA(Ile)-lysidine synthase